MGKPLMQDSGIGFSVDGEITIESPNLEVVGVNKSESSKLGNTGSNKTIDFNVFVTEVTREAVAYAISNTPEFYNNLKGLKLSYVITNVDKIIES